MKLEENTSIFGRIGRSSKVRVSSRVRCRKKKAMKDLLSPSETGIHSIILSKSDHLLFVSSVYFITWKK